MYAVYDTVSQTVISRNATIDDPEIEQDLVTLEEIITEKPEYNYRSQKLEEIETVDLNQNTITITWQIKDLTQEEIDDIIGDYYLTSEGIKLSLNEKNKSAFLALNASLDLKYPNLIFEDQTELALNPETNEVITVTVPKSPELNNNISIKDVWGDTYNISIETFKDEMIGYTEAYYDLFLESSFDISSIGSRSGHLHELNDIII